MHEFETYVDIDGERGIVTVSYELDGYKPLGLWISNEHDVDITESVPNNEYNRLYDEACQQAVDDMHAAAESFFHGVR